MLPTCDCSFHPVEGCEDHEHAATAFCGWVHVIPRSCPTSFVARTSGIWAGWLQRRRPAHPLDATPGVATAGPELDTAHLALEVLFTLRAPSLSDVLLHFARNAVAARRARPSRFKFCLILRSLRLVECSALLHVAAVRIRHLEVVAGPFSVAVVAFDNAIHKKRRLALGQPHVPLVFRRAHLTFSLPSCCSDPLPRSPWSLRSSLPDPRRVAPSSACPPSLSKERGEGARCNVQQFPCCLAGLAATCTGAETEESACRATEGATSVARDAIRSVQVVGARNCG
jgi:hypothetical protein